MEQQEEITRQVQEFLKRGGKIQQCGDGEQTIDYTLKWTDGKGLQYSNEKTRALQQSTVRCNRNGDNVMLRTTVVTGKKSTRVKGFTLIEAVIVLAIVGILLAVVLPVMLGTTKGKRLNGTWGANGFIEERCIGGYRVLIGSNGKPEQIIGDNGSGVRCQ